MNQNEFKSLNKEFEVEFNAHYNNVNADQLNDISPSVAKIALKKSQSAPAPLKKWSKEETIYSGHLWKCGKIVKNWKLRYFMLCGDNQLRYYTSSDLETYKGTADLSPSNVVSVDIDLDPIHDETDGSNYYPFVILCKHRTWKLRARTAHERHQWVEALRSVVMLSTIHLILTCFI